MLDFARGHQLGQVGDGHQPGRQVLAVVEFHRVQAAAILHHHREAGVAHDGRVREDLADEARVFALITGFLAQFAHARRDRGGVLGVDHAAGNFQFNGRGPMPVLLDHHELPVGVTAMTFTQFPQSMT